MKTKEVFAAWPTQQALANDIGVGKSAVSQWGEEPPLLAQYRIERVTKRAFLANDPKVKIPD